MRVGVLASGNGSNFEALARGLVAPASVVCLVSNVPTAYALERARNLHIATEVVDHRAFTTREDFDRALVLKLQSYRVELICLAGYMRLVSPFFLEAFQGQVLNIHPSLLPQFPGLHAVRQALSAKVPTSGCTVHWVDQGLDTGQIIERASVPVLPDDTETSLAERIHHEEHRLYPKVVNALATTRRRPLSESVQ